MINFITYLKTPNHRIQSSPVQGIIYPSLSNEIDYQRHPNRDIEPVDKVFDCGPEFKKIFMDFFRSQPIYCGWGLNVFYTPEASLQDYHSAYNRGAASYRHMYEGWNEL